MRGRGGGNWGWKDGGKGAGGDGAEEVKIKFDEADCRAESDGSQRRRLRSSRLGGWGGSERRRS